MKKEKIKMKKATYVKENKTVLIATGVGILLVILAIIFLNRTLYFQTALVFSILAAGLPYIISQYILYLRAKEIEQNLPDFLRDVAESNRSGMPLITALTNASKSDYGALSQEMKIISSQISWGVAFEDALYKLAERVKSKMVRQAMLIIIESHKSGGNIADILETVSTDIRSLKKIETERRSKLKVYLVSMYFIFLLFLGILVVLTKSFIPATPQLNEAAGLVGGSTSTVSEAEFKQFFFHLCIVQALFSGLVAGQMGEGNILSGIKHSVAMILITLVIFQFFLPSPTFEDRLADMIIRTPMTTTGIESAKTSFTMTESMTANEVVELVKLKASKAGIEGYETLTIDNILFLQGECAPCENGNIIVQENTIIVNKKSKISYSIMTDGSKYTVIISG